MAKGLFVVSRCKSDSICLLLLHLYHHPVKRCKREERERLLSAIYKTVQGSQRVDILPAAATFSLFIAEEEEEEELCGGPADGAGRRRRMMMLMIFQRGQQKERGNTSCSISPKALIVLNREFRTSVRSFRVIEIVSLSLLSLPDCHSSCNSGTDPNNHYSLASLWLRSNLRPFPPAEKTNCLCWPVVYFSIPNPPRTYNHHKNHDNIRRRLVFSLARSHLSSTL